MAAAYDPKSDFYTLLGVAERATADEIKLAYRNKMRVVHPDRNNGSALATRQAQLVNLAYRTLTTPALRSRYDLARRQHKNPQRPLPATRTAERPTGHSGPRVRVIEEPGWGTILGSIAVAGLTAGGMALLQRFIKRRRA